MGVGGHEAERVPLIAAVLLPFLRHPYPLNDFTQWLRFARPLELPAKCRPLVLCPSPCFIGLS